MPQRQSWTQRLAAHTRVYMNTPEDDRSISVQAWYGHHCIHSPIDDDLHHPPLVLRYAAGAAARCRALTNGNAVAHISGRDLRGRIVILLSITAKELLLCWWWVLTTVAITAIMTAITAIMTVFSRDIVVNRRSVTMLLLSCNTLDFRHYA